MYEDIFIGQPALVTDVDLRVADAALGQFLPEKFPNLQWRWEQKTSGSTLHYLSDEDGDDLVIIMARAGGPAATSCMVWIDPDVEQRLLQAQRLIWQFWQWLAEDQSRYRSALTPPTPPEPEKLPEVEAKKSRKKRLTERQIRMLIEWKKAENRGDNITDWCAKNNQPYETINAWRKKAEEEGLPTLEALKRRLNELIND